MEEVWLTVHQSASGVTSAYISREAAGRSTTGAAKEPRQQLRPSRKWVWWSFCHLEWPSNRSLLHVCWTTLAQRFGHSWLKQKGCLCFSTWSLGAFLLRWPTLRDRGSCSQLSSSVCWHVGTTSPTRIPPNRRARGATRHRRTGPNTRPLSGTMSTSSPGRGQLKGGFGSNLSRLYIQKKKIQFITRSTFRLLLCCIDEVWTVKPNIKMLSS